MNMRLTIPVLRAGSALLAGGLGFTLAMNLLDTEAGGGQLSGPLIRLCLGGSVVLLLCAVLVFVRPGVVGWLALLGAGSCLPLFLYRVAPSLLSWASSAPASIVQDGFFNLDPLGIGGLLATGFLWLAYAKTSIYLDHM